MTPERKFVSIKCEWKCPRIVSCGGLLVLAYRYWTIRFCYNTDGLVKWRTYMKMLRLHKQDETGSAAVVRSLLWHIKSPMFIILNKFVLSTSEDNAVASYIKIAKMFPRSSVSHRNWFLFDSVFATSTRFLLKCRIIKQYTNTPHYIDFNVIAIQYIINGKLHSLFSLYCVRTVEFA